MLVPRYSIFIAVCDRVKPLQNTVSNAPRNAFAGRILYTHGHQSRDRVFGSSVRASEQRAAAARKEADKRARDAWNKHMLGLSSPRRCLGDALNAGFGYPCKRSCPVAAHHQDLGK